VDKSRATIYIDDLFLTFEIKPNTGLFKYWVNTFMDFNEDIVKDGLMQVMDMCRKGTMCDGRRARQVFNDLVFSKNIDKIKKIKFPDPEDCLPYEQVILISSAIKAGLRKMNTSDWVLAEYLESLATVYRQLNEEHPNREFAIARGEFSEAADYAKQHENAKFADIKIFFTDL